MSSEILYKYFDFDGGIKSLQNLSLRYRRPNEFNDPFEFMPGGYSGDSQEERKRRALAILCSNPIYKDLYNSKHKTNFSQSEWNGLIKNNDPRVHNFTSQEFTNDIFNKLQQRDWSNFRDNASERVVFCSFSKKNNDILMWSHYTNEHRGIVIGFDSSHFDRLHKVSYNPQRVLVPLSSTVDQNTLKKSIEEIMTTKSPQWQYEDEWRRIISSDEVEKKGNLLLQKFPIESVLTVILGYRISKEQKQQLKTVLSQYPNFPKLKQVKLHQRDFSLEIKDCQ